MPQHTKRPKRRAMRRYCCDLLLSLSLFSIGLQRTTHWPGK